MRLVPANSLTMSWMANTKQRDISSGGMSGSAAHSASWKGRRSDWPS